MAAYNAGFDADSTGDEIAGANEGQLGGLALRNAERALDRLNSISAKGKPLSLAELKAKTSLLRGILKFEHGNHWPQEAIDYIEHCRAPRRVGGARRGDHRANSVTPQVRHTPSSKE